MHLNPHIHPHIPLNQTPHSSYMYPLTTHIPPHIHPTCIPYTSKINPTGTPLSHSPTFIPHVLQSHSSLHSPHKYPPHHTYSHIIYHSPTHIHVTIIPMHQVKLNLCLNSRKQRTSQSLTSYHFFNWCWLTRATFSVRILVAEAEHRLVDVLEAQTFVSKCQCRAGSRSVNSAFGHL